MGRECTGGERGAMPLREEMQMKELSKNKLIMNNFDFEFWHLKLEFTPEPQYLFIFMCSFQ